MSTRSRCIVTLLLSIAAAAQQQPVAQQQPAESKADPGYTLGPGDQISIWALGADEIAQKPVRVDTSGYIDVPLAGRFHAAGLTLDQLKHDLTERLKSQLTDPQVTTNITEFGSQPVSIIGAVNKPGTHQLQGRKSLVEVLSMAEGLRTDAGGTIRVTRPVSAGPLPLLGAAPDPSGQFITAEVRVQELMNGRSPASNIPIKPYDVISVERAPTVYVIGEVHKPGGFVLADRDRISVLQALSLAEGMNHGAKGSNARILRSAGEGQSRTQIALDVNRLMAGKAEDISLRPDDILFIPQNQVRNAAIRAAEAAVNIGTGIAIWRVGLPVR